jgi:putative hydrolase of the HAD superfamily
VAKLSLFPPGRRPAVFFDAVGTLLYAHPPVLSVYASIGQRHGCRLSPGLLGSRFREAFRRQEQIDHQGKLKTSEEREWQRWHAIVAEVFALPNPEDCLRELWDHFARPGSWRLAENAGPILETLARRGHALGIASNFDARLRAIVAGFPSLHPIQHLVISSEVGWRKPAPSFFRTLSEKAGLPPERILLLGDDPINDREGARAAGMQVLLVDAQRREEASIANLAEVLGWLPSGEGERGP